MDCRATVDRLPPFLQVWELCKVDAGEVCEVDPAVVCNVGDRVLVADEVGVVLELVVEDSHQTFRLTHITLHGTKSGQYAASNLDGREAGEKSGKLDVLAYLSRVWDSFLGQSEEVVGLTLHGPQTTVLPSDPLLLMRQLRVFLEREAVLRVCSCRSI